MYPDYMQESLKKVARTRSERLKLAKSGKPLFPMMNSDQRAEVLSKFHPDYQDDARRPIKVGPSKGDIVTSEVAENLEAYARISPDIFNLDKPDIETDVLVIGAGSAGFAAALLAAEKGARVTLVTKLRIGDSNSMMAQGGIQSATRPNDSPVLHYLDVLGGGHFDNIPELARALVDEAPDAIEWLTELGVMFDRNPNGTMKTKAGGGTSRARMHSARDYTGAAICRTLRDEVQNRPDQIKIYEHMPAIELLKDDKGRVAGAVCYHLENKTYMTMKAGATIIATGGFGRLHIKGFETSNHYGATADGIVIGYRAGAKLMFMDSVQYHPTGAVFPSQILGFLCTEKLRALGAQPVNSEGELFVHPLEPRDIEASAFIRECVEIGKGIKSPAGNSGIWLDTPLIEMIHGPGTIQENLPAMLRQYQRFDVNITTEPMLVYPTLHYQNGGLLIDEKCETNIPGLYCCGEAAGGIHGRNRLMGNSQLDLIVFGRRAGVFAAQCAADANVGKLNLDHITNYEKDVEALGVDRKVISPMLLPDYTPEGVKARQLTAHYDGSLR
ncbi:MAG: FAD-dependent oxidoreductase [Candidatus Cloacimonetes bacterium]|nr:FAD-dependent oxidoreductase [Candidatus Cloacimonadota bacterium]